MAINTAVLGKALMAANTSLRKKQPLPEIIEALRFWLMKGGYTVIEAKTAVDQWRKNHNLK